MRQPLPKLRIAIFGLPFLPIWLAPLILFGPTLLTGRVLYWGTPFLQFIPWRIATVHMLANGEPPFWNALNGMGAPLLANYQSGLLYPPNWLALLFGAIGGVGALAWSETLIVLLHVIWAGMGMALLVRALGMNTLAQTTGGLAFGLSSYLISRTSFLSMNAAVPWLPWVIFGATRMILSTGKSVFNRILPLTGSISMLLLAGHAQTAWYSLCLGGVWVIYLGWRSGGWRYCLKTLLWYTGATVLSAAIAAVQLVPTLEYLRQSPRASSLSYDFTVNYSFWPWRILSLFAPDLFGNPAQGDYWFNAYFWEDAIYIGLLPILMAIYTLFRKTKVKEKETLETIIHSRSLPIFLWLLVIITFVIAMGRYTPIFPFLYKNIPTFDMFQAPTRWTIIIEFAIALLAALGVHHWQCPTGRGLYWARLGTAGSFAITLGALIVWIGILGDVNQTFIRAVSLTGIFALGIGLLTLTAPKDKSEASHPLWVFALVVLLSADLLLADWGMNPSIQSSLYTHPAANLKETLDLTVGHRLLIEKGTEEELKFARFFKVEAFQISENWDNLRGVYLPDANLVDGIASVNNFDPLIPDRFSRWMSLYNSADPVSQKTLLKWMDVSAVETIDGATPYGVRLKPAEGASRWRWASCVIPVANEEEAFNKVQDSLSVTSGNSDLHKVILEGVNLDGGEPCDGEASAQITPTEIRSSRAAVSINAPKAGWLIQSDTWYPGWTATVDGKPTQVLPANGAFRAIRIPEGEHEVVLQYQPSSFTYGLMVTAAALLSLGLWALLSKRKNPFDKNVAIP